MEKPVRIAEAAEIVLKDAAEPMRARDIAAAIAERNLFQFKTNDTASMVAKALRHNERFTKTAAGTFQLVRRH